MIRTILVVSIMLPVNIVMEFSEIESVRICCVPDSVLDKKFLVAICVNIPGCVSA